MQNLELKLGEDFGAELTQLREELGADFAIISQIDGEEYTVLAIASDFDVISAGQQFVTRDTFCNDVVESSNVVYFPHVGGIQELTTHPIYTAMRLEAYLGIPLKHDGKVVGTLNFSYYTPHMPDLSGESIDKARELAERIEDSIRFQPKRS